MLLARYLPGFLGGGDFSGEDDVRLPMEYGAARDPRLPAPSTLDEIRGGFEVFKGLGSRRDPGVIAQPVARPDVEAGAIRKPVQRGPAPSVDELRRRIDAMGIQ